MPAAVGFLVIDTTDPGRLAPFWCALLEVEVDAIIGDGQFVVLSRTAAGLTVGFQQVLQPKVDKNRLHLDLIVEDLDTSTAESTAYAGGGRVRLFLVRRRGERASSGCPAGVQRHRGRYAWRRLPWVTAGGGLGA